MLVPSEGVTAMSARVTLKNIPPLLSIGASKRPRAHVTVGGAAPEGIAEAIKQGRP